MVSKKVAVIGAGASGLVAARELRSEGHKVVVYKQGTQLGGVWVYSPEIESDPLGVDPTRKTVHSSLYESLRVNLPREFMGFRDFPFVASGKSDRDSRRFPHHSEVLRYLQDFACAFNINELVRYQTKVCYVGLDKGGRWMVKSKKEDDAIISDETYDAVVLCSGHHTEPRLADVPGVELWPGRQLHSHNYRTPGPYQDQVVVIIGSSVSAFDISKEIAEYAKEVHVAIRSKLGTKLIQKFGNDSIQVHEMIERAYEDGTVAFQDGSAVLADVIIHCTGYRYHYPFLDTGGAVNVDDNRVGPLYKHVFPPALAPTISFVGIPFFTGLFFLFELQSKWIAGVLSERILLPSEEDMKRDVEALYAKLEAAGVPNRDTHSIMDYDFGYENWLAKQCGCSPTEKWRKSMFIRAVMSIRTMTDTYRDQFDDSEESVLQAHQDFVLYLAPDENTNTAAATRPTTL